MTPLSTLNSLLTSVMATISVFSNTIYKCFWLGCFNLSNNVISYIIFVNKQAVTHGRSSPGPVCAQNVHVYILYNNILITS